MVIEEPDLGRATTGQLVNELQARMLVTHRPELEQRLKHVKESLSDHALAFRTGEHCQFEENPPDKAEVLAVMHETVMSIDTHPPGEALAIALINRMATLGYGIRRRRTGEVCQFCLEPLAEHTESERRSCEIDLEAARG